MSREDKFCAHWDSIKFLFRSDRERFGELCRRRTEVEENIVTGDVARSHDTRKGMSWTPSRGRVKERSEQSGIMADVLVWVWKVLLEGREKWCAEVCIWRGGQSFDSTRRKAAVKGKGE